MREVLKLGLALMMYAMTFGVALAVVSAKTAPVIAANRQLRSMEARAEVLPGMVAYTEREAGEVTCWVASLDAAGTKIGGYILTARGSGYASTIETMVGVDPDGRITGMAVVSQNETPGLGDGVADSAFTGQFIGKLPGDLKLSVDGGTIDGVTGATISSRAVTASVRDALVVLDLIRGDRS